ncbi:MAG: hypothetical protein U0836_26960 [Pirellulales bacterium]
MAIPLWQIRLTNLQLAIADDRKHRQAGAATAYAELVDGVARGQEFFSSPTIAVLDAAGKSAADLDRDVAAAAAKLSA